MEVKGKLFLYKDAATQDKEDPVEDDFFIHLAELGSTSLFESTGQKKPVSLPGKQRSIMKKFCINIYNIT